MDLVVVAVEGGGPAIKTTAMLDLIVLDPA
jgi:hypothetical protein